MSIEFRIAETENFRKAIAKGRLEKEYGKIRDFIYPQLRVNPFFGPNIKKLKGQFKNYYRFRIGGFRLFYQIDQGKVLVIVVSLTPRKDAYP